MIPGESNILKSSLIQLFLSLEMATMSTLGQDKQWQETLVVGGKRPKEKNSMNFQDR